MMIRPGIPVKDQDKPFIEENTGPGAGQGNRPQQPVPEVTRQAEQDARPYTPVPEPPPVWTGYAPGTPPPWAWQPGVYTPYPPRRPSRWPWVVLTLVLLFLLIGGGITVLFGVFAFTGYATSVTQTQTYTMSTYPMLVLAGFSPSCEARGRIRRCVLVRKEGIAGEPAESGVVRSQCMTFQCAGEPKMGGKNVMTP